MAISQSLHLPKTYVNKSIIHTLLEMLHDDMDIKSEIAKSTLE